MDIYYGFVKNRDTERVTGKKTSVGVAGALVKGKPRYVALSVSTTEKRFEGLLKDLAAPQDVIKKEAAPIKPLLDEVRAYFKGGKRKFSFKPHFVKGTDFQQAVWKALSTVPYGKTESYGGIAGKIGNPKASRAVGMANHANPISLVVPCHRVIGSDGSLTGYGGGGVKVKRRLLDLEGAP